MNCCDVALVLDERGRLKTFTLHFGTVSKARGINIDRRLP